MALESPTPRDELIEFELDNDVLRIDGNMAVAWSNSLNFSVEKSTKSLLGSAVSGEGFVNVYRGTGKVLMAPVGLNQKTEWEIPLRFFISPLPDGGFSASRC